MVTWQLKGEERRRQRRASLHGNLSTCTQSGKTESNSFQSSCDFLSLHTKHIQIWNFLYKFSFFTYFLLCHFAIVRNILIFQHGTDCLRNVHIQIPTQLTQGRISKVSWGFHSEFQAVQVGCPFLLHYTFFLHKEPAQRL